MSLWCCYRCNSRPDDKFTTSQTNIKQRPCNYSSYLSKTGSLMTGCAVINWLYPCSLDEQSAHFAQVLHCADVDAIVKLFKSFNQHLPMLLAYLFYWQNVVSLLFKILLYIVHYMWFTAVQRILDTHSVFKTTYTLHSFRSDSRT